MPYSSETTDKYNSKNKYGAILVSYSNDDLEADKDTHTTHSSRSSLYPGVRGETSALLHTPSHTGFSQLNNTFLATVFLVTLGSSLQFGYGTGTSCRPFDNHQFLDNV
jgi:hypothetical protein